MKLENLINKDEANAIRRQAEREARIEVLKAQIASYNLKSKDEYKKMKKVALIEEFVRIYGYKPVSAWKKDKIIDEILGVTYLMRAEIVMIEALARG